MNLTSLNSTTQDLNQNFIQNYFYCSVKLFDWNLFDVDTCFWINDEKLMQIATWSTSCKLLIIKLTYNSFLNFNTNQICCLVLMLSYNLIRTNWSIMKSTCILIKCNKKKKKDWLLHCYTCYKMNINTKCK